MNLLSREIPALISQDLSSLQQKCRNQPCGGDFPIPPLLHPHPQPSQPSSPAVVSNCPGCRSLNRCVFPPDGIKMTPAQRSRPQRFVQVQFERTLGRFRRQLITLPVTITQMATRKEIPHQQNRPPRSTDVKAMWPAILGLLRLSSVRSIFPVNNG